ncbi:MAG: GAF domain-containing protein [Anaerolineae bacterium]|jgi:PAS domain S-box-containing protein|nr:GAF domain-containing protein [Anaerolineae bacterium]MBT3713657.1 GAF domain-containing protein [Anaerolineae bacterium]MBT4311463.1 GAF domain-containing protein [Anaerolineae bacterium]MBT4458643.1 GAF domain-containing protein [Anaerolineae bacterium]MBT6062985.1 GAF domain-containing protein [Anaerolineae bacterium]
MSKKKINNRLDKLFDDIKEEEKTLERPPQKNIGGGTKKLPSLDVALSSEKHRKTKPDSLDMQVDVTDSYATMSLPLRMDTDSWGTLQIVDNTPQRKWDTEEQLLVQQVTEQLSLALENARLFEETQQRTEELTLINDIVGEVSQILDVHESLQLIAKKLVDADIADHVGIAILNKNETSVILVADAPLEKDDIGLKIPVTGITDEVIKTQKPTIINDIRIEPRLEGIRDALLLRGRQGLAIFPLISGVKTIGTVGLDFNQKDRNLEPDEIRLIQTILLQVGNSIETAQLFEETERRRKELALVNKIVTQISSTLEMQDDLVYIAKEIAEISDALHVGIALLDEEKKNLVLTADFPPNAADLGLRLPLENNPTSKQVLENQQPLSILDVQNNPLTVSIKDIMKERKTESLVIFPVLAGNEAIGTLGVDFDDPEKTLSGNQIDLIQTILLQISTSIETSRLFDKTQESETEFRSLFAAMDDVIFVVDKDTRYLRIAPTNPSGLYLPPEELLGKRMDEILPKEIHSLVHGAIQQTLEGGKTVSVEYPLDIDGKEVWFDANLSKLGENQVYWVARDITERKESERALQDAHARVQFILDSTTVPMHITSTADGTFLYANQAVSDTLGLPLDEILGTLAGRFYYSAEELEEFNKTTQKYGGFLNIETRYKRGDGEMFWGLSSTRSFEYEGQESWLSTVIDITDIKNTENTLQRQNEYMEAAAEVGRLVTSTLDLDILFRRAVNLLQEHFKYYHAAIFTSEEAGAGLSVVVREATGKAGEEMKKNEHSLEIGSKSVIGTATEKGEPYVVNDVSKNPNHRHNPLLPDTKAEAAIPLKIGRRIIGAIDLQATEVDAFSLEDIDVLQLLADQFATAIDNARSYKLAQDAFFEMRELEKLKSQFLANMSHELRTPLNSIIGFSRVILKGIDGPVTDLQQQDLSAIYNSGQHLLGLINDILDLSKIEAGKMELTFDEVDIEKLIKSVMSTVMGLVKDKPVHLEDEIESNLPPVKADSMRIRQILINLFSNAAKFTDEGTIKVIAKSEGSNVRISVIDSGPGISEEDQEKLFQAFSQVDASATRATGGSGLGLSISKELVTMHGGEIGLSSEVGTGSTFYFTLPFFDSPEIEAEYETEDKKAQADDLIILAIDDDEDVIHLYQRYLNTQGYLVIPLTEPQKAVERAKELKPYAITLDIMMPGYDGWQVLQDLKSDPETQNFPTIICSIVEDTKKGYSLGATDYLLKPIIGDDLLGSLSRINKGGEIHEILLIDDNPDNLRFLEKLLLETQNYRPIIAENGPTGWDKITNNPPQAVILDLFMLDMSGFEIIEAMQASVELRKIPVIIISEGDISATQQEKLDSLNHHLLQKGSLDSKELLATLERSLNHLKKPELKGKE